MAEGGSRGLVFYAAMRGEAFPESCATHYTNGETASALLTENFAFNPHWRDTTVSVDLSALADASGHFAGQLVVKNEWGDRTAKAFSCTASDDGDDAAAPSAR